MNYSIHYIRTKEQKEERQNEELLGYIGQFVSEYNILKAVFFLPSGTDEQFHARAEQLKALLNPTGKSYSFPVSYVAQKSPDHSLTAELWAVQDIEPRYRSFMNRAYSLIETDGKKLLFSPGITGQGSGTAKDTAQVMQEMQALLSHEGMEPGQLVRQWNYIPRIINTSIKKQNRQNYQLFNNARAVFYNRHHFTSGFPASTGIGMKCGPLTISFIAQSGISTKALSNPWQTDAHKYSGKVLVPAHEDKPDESPRFERAKAFRIGQKLHVYVSGTAAIKGEETVAIGDAAEQSRITISNIEELISHENLLRHGLNHSPAKPLATYLRVYYKDLVYYPIIKAQVERSKLFTNVVYVEAHICRPDLLVEMECALIYENS